MDCKIVLAIATTRSHSIGRERPLDWPTVSHWTDDDRRSRIVFITRGLEPAEVEASWRRHCAAADAQTAGVA
jgi:hypothetical protein